jgi:hypothetical protein
VPKAKTKLPHGGRYLRAAERRFSDTIVFVHHYGGHRASTQKHQEFLNTLGFDCVSFNLSFPARPAILRDGLVGEVHWGLRERWAREIGDVLAAVGGPLIVYSFSLPSLSAATAMSSLGSSNIKAWICDGGPFTMPVTSMWNYLAHYEGSLIRRVVRLSLSFAALKMWNFKPDLDRALARFPAGFPVLSIRSWKDRLVPLATIDAAFSGHEQLVLEKLTLPEAAHIDGLNSCPEEYKPRVARFLNRYAEKMG